jgi:chromosome segregation ATPase
MVNISHKKNHQKRNKKYKTYKNLKQNGGYKNWEELVKKLEEAGWKFVNKSRAPSYKFRELNKDKLQEICNYFNISIKQGDRELTNNELMDKIEKSDLKKSELSLDPSIPETHIEEESNIKKEVQIIREELKNCIIQSINNADRIQSLDSRAKQIEDFIPIIQEKIKSIESTGKQIETLAPVIQGQLQQNSEKIETLEKKGEEIETMTPVIQEQLQQNSEKIDDLETQGEEIERMAPVIQEQLQQNSEKIDDLETQGEEIERMAPVIQEQLQQNSEKIDNLESQEEDVSGSTEEDQTKTLQAKIEQTESLEASVPAPVDDEQQTESLEGSVPAPVDDEQQAPLEGSVTAPVQTEKQVTEGGKIKKRSIKKKKKRVKKTINRKKL